MRIELLFHAATEAYTGAKDTIPFQFAHAAANDLLSRSRS